MTQGSSSEPNQLAKCYSVEKYQPIQGLLWKTSVFFNSGSSFNHSKGPYLQMITSQRMTNALETEYL